MEIVEIKKEYIDELRKSFSHVMINKGEFSIHSRKYIGIILSIKKYNYYAPFSSPKFYDYYNCGIPKESSKYVIRMTELDGGYKKILGKIVLNCMIPVPQKYVVKFNINKIYDKQYRDLLISEYIWINKNKSLIKQYAKIVYKSNDKIVLPFRKIEKYINKKYL